MIVKGNNLKMCQRQCREGRGHHWNMMKCGPMILIDFINGKFQAQPTDTRINVSAHQRKEITNAWEIIRWKNIWLYDIWACIICKNCIFYIMLPKPNFHAFFTSKPETAQETSAPRRRSSACHWPSPAPTWEQFRLESVDEKSTPATPISLGLMVPQPRASRIGVVASLPDMTFISDV